MIPKAPSQGEELFLLHCRAHALHPEREFRFHPVRKWRIDFAWPNFKLAVEIEGVTPSGGRHQRIGGMEKDAEKYNTLALDGWRLLRYTPGMVKRGEAIRDVCIAIGSTEPV